MKSLVISSPAKTNLFLKVLGKRSDGYHELLTVFHRLSLCDRLTLKKIPAGRFSLTTNHSSLRNQKNNLIAKAYELLRRHTLWRGGVDVKLEKNIPVAAGLGGGSSNAAHFLLGVNRLFSLGLPRNTLVRIGKKLGSDVPFFLYEVNQAIGRGRGEIVTPLPYRGKLWFVVVQAPFGLATKDVYRKHSPFRSKGHRLTRISRVDTITSAFFQAFKQGPRSRLKLANDLFRASLAIRPELRKIDKCLHKAGGAVRLMSGSGPTMLSIHDSRKEAESVARKLRTCKPKVRVFICHTY